jgi:hypothetical protein
MQIKVGATLYPMPSRPLELGDQRLLKREYGFIPGEDIDLNDPDQVAAILYSAMREANPDEPAARLVSRINRVREITFVGDDGEPITDEDLAEPEPDPTPAKAKKGAGATT